MQYVRAEVAQKQDHWEQSLVLTSCFLVIQRGTGWKTPTSPPKKYQPKLFVSHT